MSPISFGLLCNQLCLPDAPGFVSVLAVASQGNVSPFANLTTTVQLPTILIDQCYSAAQVEIKDLQVFPQCIVV